MAIDFHEINWHDGILRDIRVSGMSGGRQRLDLLVDLYPDTDPKSARRRYRCIGGRLRRFLVSGEIGRLIKNAKSGNIDRMRMDYTADSEILAVLLFGGNIEARDMYSGTADVIVCDGFTGNIALKTSEGLVEMVEDLLRDELTRTYTMRLGSLLTRRALRHFRRRVDYSEYGGAPLLGIAGLVVVGHGRSSAKAVRNAVAMAYRFAASRFIERVGREIAVAAVAHQ